jgi:HD-GYP domain-containing protein (c-di-GMP phosphodiesterase class II)
MDLADELNIQDPQTRQQIGQGAMLKDIGEMGVMLDSAPQARIDKMGSFLSNQDMRNAGLLHDVGKIRIPNEILYKPGKLTDEEYNLMKMHPIYSEQIVYPIASLRHLCPTIRAHHERWDGKGYPDQLAGQDIPMAARVLAVADVFDALSAKRPYKDAMPMAKVKQIMEEGRGTHFDPDMMDAFSRVLARRFPD